MRNLFGAFFVRKRVKNEESINLEPDFKSMEKIGRYNNYLKNTWRLLL